MQLLITNMLPLSQMVIFSHMVVEHDAVDMVDFYAEQRWHYTALEFDTMLLTVLYVKVIHW